MQTSNAPLSDEKETVRLLKESDEKAFEILFRFYSRRLYQFAYTYLKSSEDSKEIIQETFTRIWEKRSTIDIDKSFSGFVFTVAQRIILNRIRRVKIEHQYLSLVRQQDQKGVESTEQEMIFSDLDSVRLKALHELPPRRKLIFEMIREQGMSYKEVADKLGISVKTVEAQMTEAVKQLRARLSL